jgi:hypothetical protein
MTAAERLQVAIDEMLAAMAAYEEGRRERIRAEAQNATRRTS